MNDTTKQKITKSLDYSGDDSGAYFNEGELEPLTVVVVLLLWVFYFLFFLFLGSSLMQHSLGPRGG